MPAYVRRLFSEGAPADFVLIGATTCDPSDIDPAIRSRCAEVYFEPLTALQIREIVVGAGKRLGAKLARRVPDLIGSYTIEGRKAVQILADAYGNGLYRSEGNKHVVITEEDVTTVVRSGRLLEHSPVRARDAAEIGKTFGLGVVQYVGSIIEIEAVAFPAAEPRKGTIRFNETAGSMARDSVFNARRGGARHDRLGTSKIRHAREHSLRRHHRRPIPRRGDHISDVFGADESASRARRCNDRRAFHSRRRAPDRRRIGEDLCCAPGGNARDHYS